ncbi:MAG: GGDEF domain-containing protein [Myxococcota bacterium]
MLASILVALPAGLERSKIEQTFEFSSLDVRLRFADTTADFLNQLRDELFDVALCTLELLDSQPFKEIRHQQRAHLATLAFIETSSSAEREQCFALGGDDYILLPCVSDELICRVQQQLRLRQQEREIVRTTEQFRRVATLDPLTGLSNRRGLTDLCRRELARSRRYGFSLSLFVTSVEPFDSIMQVHGPIVGDVILTEMSTLLAKQLRSADIPAHLEGGYYGALLPQTDHHQGLLVSERLIDAVRNFAFASHATGEIKAAVGLVSFPFSSLQSVDELFTAAWTCLEHAQQAGGDRVEVWQGDRLTRGTPP